MRCRLALLPCVCIASAGCMTQPAPRTAVMARPKPPAQLAPAPDWFQHQLAEARAAGRAHLPHSDIAGKRQTYYRIALAACTQLAEHGLTKYRGHCNVLRQQSVANVPSPSEETMCDEDADSPEKVTACND